MAVNELSPKPEARSRKPYLLLLLASGVLLLVFNGCARVAKPVGGFYGAPGGVYHTVGFGETLYRIAKRYDVEVNELMRVNHIYSPSALEAGQKLFIPGKASASFVFPKPVFRMPAGPVSLEEARGIVGPKDLLYPWKTITVHHSGTTQGSARLFDRDHRRRHMGGLFYHFVIGNGTKTADGSVETGWRWKKQVPANRPNEIGRAHV